MNSVELREELKALHDQMESSLHKEPLDKDMFGHIMTDLVRVAQGEDLHKEESEGLKEQLEERASDFDTRHPKIAAIIREVMDLLSKMGI